MSKRHVAGAARGCSDSEFLRKLVAQHRATVLIADLQLEAQKMALQVQLETDAKAAQKAIDDYIYADRPVPLRFSPFKVHARVKMNGANPISRIESTALELTGLEVSVSGWARGEYFDCVICCPNSVSKAIMAAEFEPGES